MVAMLDNSAPSWYDGTSKQKETTMITWNQQTEDTDAEGFLLEGEAAFDADVAWFAELGAPNTDSLKFVDWEATDRDDADITAEGDTPEFADWLAELFMRQEDW